MICLTNYEWTFIKGVVDGVHFGMCARGIHNPETDTIIHEPGGLHLPNENLGEYERKITPRGLHTDFSVAPDRRDYEMGFRYGLLCPFVSKD